MNLLTNQKASALFRVVPAANQRSRIPAVTSRLRIVLLGFCFLVLLQTHALGAIIKVYMHNGGNCTIYVKYKYLLVHVNQSTCEMIGGPYYNPSSGWSQQPISAGATVTFQYMTHPDRACSNGSQCLGLVVGPTSATPNDPSIVAMHTLYGTNIYVNYDCNGFHDIVAPLVADWSDFPPNPDCPFGMPVWQVSEPFINLWLQDEPLGYQPAIGPRVSFGLNFRQREDVAGYNTNVFSIGPKWNCAWFSHVAPWGPYKVVHFPGGGSRIFTSTTDYLTNTRLTGATNTGYTVSYPDGRKNVYGFIVTNATGGFLKSFMTESWNRIGQSTRFYYDSYTPSTNPVIRLKYVVDGDGRTNSIAYATGNPYSTNLISSVVDPFGRTANLVYDTFGRLTNLTDVASLATSFKYDTAPFTGWVTNMTTPYGTTSFAITDTTGNLPAPVGRSVLVTEADGSKQLFLYTNGAPGVVSSYASTPGTTPYTNSVENSSLDQRNSFHWGRRQYAALSTSNPAYFTTNDFRKARMQHWLKSATNSISETLSLVRDPSPDIGGTIEGPVTWLDYAGKTNTTYFGTQSDPLLAATILPDTTTRFIRTERNSLGFVTNEVSTYSVATGVGLRTNRLTYAANGVDLLTVTNAVGVQVASNAYNAYHQVLTNFNALNERTVFTYDASNRLSSVALPTGLVTTNLYGADGFLAQQIVFGISTNAFTYSNDLVYTATDSRGLTTTNTWDALQRLRRVSFPDGTFVTNTYDKLDLVRSVDRLGYPTSFGYNPIRQMTAATNALGFYTLYDYCSCGSLNWVRDAANNFTFFYYDNAGRQTNVVYADGYAVTSYYNLLGQPTNVVDSAGASVTNYYNNQGLLAASSNAFGRVSAAIYDALDRATNAVDANAVTITNTFDNLSRLLARGYPDGGIERYGYTPNYPGVTSYTNQLGTNVVNYAYDALGRKTNEVYPGIATNQFTYSGAGDLLTLTDGKNQTTTWHFDEYGRTTNKVDATSAEIFRFSYDPNHRLTNRWTAAKGNTIYRYDALGNLTNVDYAVSPDLTFQYDALSRLTNLVDAVGTTRRSFDAVGQLLTEDGPWTSDAITNTYAHRLRQSMILQQPTGAWTNVYSYDAAKRLTNIISPAGSFGYAYDASRQSLLARIALPNTAFITNSYDAMTRLLSTKLLTSSSQLLNAHAYSYNLANQRTGQTNTMGDFRAYAYDGIGQLVGATGFERNWRPRHNEQLGYTYDPAGNLNFRTNDALVQTFVVDSLNQLTTQGRSGTLTVSGNTSTPATNVTVNGLTATRYSDLTWAKDGLPLVDGTTNFTAVAANSAGAFDTNTVTVDSRATRLFAYDLNGNLLSDGKRGFEYDDENQLTRITATNACKTELTYDGQHRRRIRKEFAWQSGAWTQTNEVRYLFDGGVVVQERDSGNTPQVSYTRTGLSLLARTDNSTGTNAYYHADGNLNITALVNTNQFLVATYVYDPFGRILSQGGPLAEANVYQFSSQEFHRASGLSLYLRRAYDSNLQRWLNADPLGEKGSVNLHRFVRNNPVSFMDPDGRVETSLNSPLGQFLAPVADVASLIGKGAWALAGITVDSVADKLRPSPISLPDNYVASMIWARQHPFGDVLFPDLSVPDDSFDSRWGDVAEGVFNFVLLALPCKGINGASRAAESGARFSRVGGAAGDFLVPGEATLQAGLRDPALYGTRLTTTPTFNAALEPLGQVTGRGLNASVEIGPGAFSSRGNLIQTIIHEETHIRLDLRAVQGSQRALGIQSTITAEEAYVEAVAQRFWQRYGGR
jgi:RHS repeat-associated protein